MEDTLREREFFGHPFTFKSLNPCFNGRYSQRQHNFCAHTGEIVLILVLMEDTLREPFTAPNPNPVTSLNPCFNGRYSQSLSTLTLSCQNSSLNPCFNGRYSQSDFMYGMPRELAVLILVLMEDTLRVISCMECHVNLQS